MNKMIKKVTLLVLSMAILTTTTACNENDVVAGVIIGGIIGGAVAGGGVTVVTPGPYKYSFLSDCEGYSREWICEWSYGGWHRVQRRYRPYNSSLFETLQTSTNAPAIDLKSQEISKKWALDAESSVKLANAIENAKGGDLKAFKKIGLNLTTLNHMLTKQKIDANDLTAFADKLNTNENTALAILNSFNREYSTQKKDVNSALWSQCQSKKQWKTPETASCVSLSAKGCSPALGASNCLPL